MAKNPGSKELSRAAVQALERLGLQFLDNEVHLPSRASAPDQNVQELDIELGTEGLEFDDVVAKLGRIMDATPSLATIPMGEVTMTPGSTSSTHSRAIL